MSAETERLAELVIDLGNRLSQAFGDVISPEAQRHLRNAQREALTALFLIYEEQVGRRAPRGPQVDDDDPGVDWPHDMEEAIRDARASARRAGRREAGRAAPSPKVKKIDID
ncbi:MAG: hypothetical protein ACREOV_00615 [Candidatus Dormibacteraceae bacterium]